MNFVKRAGLSLLVRKGKSLIMLGLFTVISTLVLSGFLLQSAAAQSTTNAKSQVGADATLDLDMQKMMQSGSFSGSLGANQTLYANQADALGKSPLVQSYDYSVDDGTHAPALKPVATGQPPANLPAEMRDDMLPITGVLDSSQVAEFKNGKYTIVAGRNIGPSDAQQNNVLVEQRYAEKNNLKVGDKVTLTANDPASTDKLEFTVTGIYHNPDKSPSQWTMPQMDPGNKLFASIAGLGRLNKEDMTGGRMRINTAVFTLKDPSTLPKLKAAATAAGIDMNIFELTVNDKNYQAMVGPIENTGRFANLGVWLVSVAGAAILGLLVTLWVKERRKELGILLSMGERKWRLVAQYVVEVGAIALLAIGFSALAGQTISQKAGDSLLSNQVASAAKNPVTQAGAPSQQGGGATSATAQTPVTVKPIDKIKVLMHAGDVAEVAAVGLGIGLAAVVIPGVSIIRTNPRSILVKGD